MKLEEAMALVEAPLPSDWDESVYSSNIPFKRRVEYAKQRAEQIGRGSSRVVLKIKYQGRDTALKVALNRKGMAQNEAEAQLLGDGYVMRSGLVIPMIDYDERNPMPTWIHTEFAEKMRGKGQFKTMTGLDIDELSMFLTNVDDERRGRRPTFRTSNDMWNNDFASRLATFVTDLGIPAGDFGRTANWGVYRGRPVIVDLGLSDDVLDTHYR